MLIYFFTSLISTIFAFLSVYLKKVSLVQHSMNFLICGFSVLMSFLPLYIVSAIRYLVGTDYAGTYRAIYNYTYALGYHFRITGESLYGLLNRIAMIYSGADYVGVFYLSSLLICGFIFVGLWKQSAYFPYSVLLWIISGYYFWSFNAVRQSIAMAIFVFAIKYIQKCEPWKYFAWIMIASGFHTMGLLYLPAYFINKFRINYKIMFVLSFLCIVFPKNIRQLAYAVTIKIPIFNTYASRYFESARFESNTESSLSHLFINLAFFILFIFIAFLTKNKNKISIMWINIQYFALAFSLLSNVLPLANRMSRFFEIVLILSIPSMTRMISNKELRLCINISIIICFCLYTYITYFVLGYHDVLPYRTIFSR